MHFEHFNPLNTFRAQVEFPFKQWLLKGLETLAEEYWDSKGFAERPPAAWRSKSAFRI